MLRTTITLLVLSLFTTPSLAGSFTPITTGLFSASIQPGFHGDALVIEGPAGPEVYDFNFSVDVFRQEFLSDRGLFLASAEATNDGFAFFAQYGNGGGFDPRQTSTSDGGTATGNFGLLTYSFPYWIGDNEVGTYAQFSGHLNYVLTGLPVNNEVISTLQVGYSASDYFEVPYPAHWFLPVSAVPESSSFSYLCMGVAWLAVSRLRKGGV